MDLDVETLKEILGDIATSSKAYVNISNRNLDSGELLRQIWLARSLTKTKAKDLLIDVSLYLKELTEIKEILINNNVITILSIENGTEKELVYFLLPVGIELIKILSELEKNSIEINELLDIINEAHLKFQFVASEEMISRLLEPLKDADKMGAKDAVFCWFLLVSGSVSEKTAFVLKKNEATKEFELQDDIVSYLNYLSEAVYNVSYYSNKFNKIFKSGNLDDFVRRDRNIRSTYGDLFKPDRENSLIYFNATNEEGSLEVEAIRRIIYLTLKKLVYFAIESDKVYTSIPRIVTEFRIDNPIPQANQGSLFVGRPMDDYYPLLEDLVDEQLEVIREENSSDE